MRRCALTYPPEHHLLVAGSKLGAGEDAARRARNVEVTGAARFYRAASALTAGFGLAVEGTTYGCSLCIP